MSLMTDSKIIHQAEESQEFQQNPQYYHRNINPDQIYTDINQLSSHVNNFLKKFNHSNFNPKKVKSSMKNYENQQNSFMAKSSVNENIINQRNSQIDELASKTQNFIEGLNLSKSKNFTLFSQNNKNYPILSSSKTKQKSNNQQKNYLTKKNFPFNHSLTESIDRKNVTFDDFTEATKIKINQQKFPKTVNVPRKTAQQIKKYQNYHSNLKISPFQGKFNNQFDDFDDQDTVVNEPVNKIKRKFHKKNPQKEPKTDRAKQTPYKLTKKHLLQKILNLQNTVKQLKYQKFQLLQAPCKNNIFYKPKETKNAEKQGLIERLKLSYKIQQPKKPQEKTLYHKGSINFSQRGRSLDARSSQNYQKVQRKQSQYSQNRARSSLKNQDQKISLKKWAQQIW